MYHYLIFRPDKKETWKIYGQKQLAGLEKNPAFMTVLAVDQDPEVLEDAGEDSLEHVKFLGPMYWDFDGTDLDVVLDDSRKLVEWLRKKMDVPDEFINVWLSGQKGVHITVPEEIFGVRTPTKLLPWIYKEIALSIPLDTMDMGVYSAGKGRMWRCEGIPRPGTGTFKVGVTLDELESMDAQQYEVLVATARPALELRKPDKVLAFPKAETLMKMAKSTANRKFRAYKDDPGVQEDVLKNIEGIPGCIEKLITEGDCPESNWNQAAMQLAAYIGAKYDRSESKVYDEELVDPFVRNVENGTRPTVAERKKHVREQINRAFGGRMKFRMGPLVNTLGAPCGHCVLCRSDLAEGLDAEDGDGTIKYCDDTKIRQTPKGMYMVGENSSRQLTTFTFKADSELIEMQLHDKGIRELGRAALKGTLTDDTGREFKDFEMPEGAWAGAKDLRRAVEGRGSVAVYSTDVEVQKMLRAVLNFSGNDMIKTTKSPVCGIIFERKGSNVIPHYVEEGGSFTQTGNDNRYFFSGEGGLSPDLLNESDPYPDDTELEDTLKAMFNVNVPEVVAATVGWTVACHFREHIQSSVNQFPLMNLTGGANAGKSSFLFIVLNLSGLDYCETDFVNSETASFYPILRAVSSSSTIPRLVEEMNPTVMGFKKYNQVLGLLKGGWNRAPIPRGYIGSGREVKVSNDRVSSPIVYTSEQPPSISSLLSRTLGANLAVKTLYEPSYKEAFKVAHKGRRSLHRMGRALVSLAMSMPPDDVMAMYDANEGYVSDSIGTRPKFSVQTALVGLDLLKKACEMYEVDVVQEIADLKAKYIAHLSNTLAEQVAEKRITEVDRVLMALDDMATSSDDRSYGLEAGTHYWRQGNTLYLVLQSILPRYRRYAKSINENAVITHAQAMSMLLQGENYFIRTEKHPHRPSTTIHVIDLKRLSSKGTHLNNFQDGTEAENK